MNRRYVLIGVEGNHDQAFLERILLKLLRFSKWDEKFKTLDQIWHKFIPTYSPRATNKFYARLDMPSILNKDDVSVAIYVGGGTTLIPNLNDKFSNNFDLMQSLSAFAIVVDADQQTVTQVAQKYHDGFKEYFPDFPTEVKETGIVTGNSPKLGLYILPDNQNQGVLDTLLCKCGEVAYPDYIERAKEYIEKFTNWKNFDKQKATVATVVSVLKPGSTNTASIAGDKWVSNETQKILQNLTTFLQELILSEQI